MRDDRLKALFDEADTAPSPPLVGPGELARGVWATYDRRRKRRVRTAAAATILGLGALVWQVGNWRQGPHTIKDTLAQPSEVVPENTELAAALAELDQMQREIAHEERIVERLVAAERRNRLTDAAEQMEIVPERHAVVAEQAGRAALAMLVAADQKRGRIELWASAQQDYACVIDLFPNTPWADEARQRLAAFGP